jgi:sugar phosphate isomerase/epimerase
MRIGIWTQFFGEMTPEAAVQAFASKGWRVLELSTEHSAVLLERGDPASVGGRFAAFASGLGVSLPQGHLWLDVDVTRDDQAAVIDALKRWLDMYMAIGIRAAVIHAGGGPLKAAGADRKLIFERRATAFRALASHIEGSPLTLCIENTPEAPTLDEILGLIKAVGSPQMAVCLDTGHANIDRVDQAAFVAGCGPLLRALHVHDNDGTGDQHLMPYGSGSVPWPDVIAALKRISYDGLFCFEIPGETRCPLPARLAKLDYLKAVMPTLLEDAKPRYD